MKTNLIFFFSAMFSFFAPIQMLVLILMFTIFVDTVVKLISLKKIAEETKRKYKDVFKSKILRLGYLYKTAGYFIMVLVIFPIDYYALTPFTSSTINALGYWFILPTTAVYTNFLLCIFSIIELSSINENWFDITGNNMLKSVSDTVKKIRGGIEKASDTYKNIKK